MKSAKTYDVVVALDGFTSKYPDLPRLLRPLSLPFDGSNLRGVDLYYRNLADSALLILKIDMTSVTGPLIQQISRAAREAGCVAFELPKLPLHERALFEGSHLKQYEISVSDLPMPRDALYLLGDRLGLTPPTVDFGTRATAYGSLDVRFLRGGVWQPGRVCRISDAGVYVATGALPRRGDIVEIELAIDQQTLRLPAQIVQTTSIHAATTVGTAGFGARFMFPEKTHYGQLASLLRRANDILARLAPPPRRRDVRYPIKWPCSIGYKGRQLEMTCLDVSRNGLFLMGQLPVGKDAVLDVMLPLDHRGEPIRAKGRAIRTVVGGQKTRPSGVGIELVASPSDTARFAAFVDRVSRRVEKRVLVGATGPRMDALIESMTAAGYSASGANDAATLYAKATETSQPPDAVVIDGSLEQVNQRHAQVLRRKLGYRRITTVDTRLEPAAQARLVVDSTLRCDEDPAPEPT